MLDVVSYNVDPAHLPVFLELLGEEVGDSKWLLRNYLASLQLCSHNCVKTHTYNRKTSNVETNLNTLYAYTNFVSEVMISKKIYTLMSMV